MNCSNCKEIIGHDDIVAHLDEGIFCLDCVNSFRKELYEGEVSPKCDECLEGTEDYTEIFIIPVENTSGVVYCPDCIEDCMIRGNLIDVN